MLEPTIHQLHSKPPAQLLMEHQIRSKSPLERPRGRPVGAVLDAVGGPDGGPCKRRRDLAQGILAVLVLILRWGLNGNGNDENETCSETCSARRDINKGG